jgi:hypothetical protein
MFKIEFQTNYEAMSADGFVYDYMLLARLYAFSNDPAWLTISSTLFSTLKLEPIQPEQNQTSSVAEMVHDRAQIKFIATARQKQQWQVEVSLTVLEVTEMLQHWMPEVYFWILLWLIVAIALLVTANTLAPPTIVAMF